MKLLLLLSAIIWTLHFAGATSASRLVNRLAKRPDCSDCIGYLDVCLNTCGPANPKCKVNCQEKTCTEGPSHCHKGQECAFPVDVWTVSQPLDSRDDQEDCGSCASWMRNCKRSHCARPWAPECRYDCKKKLCQFGPGECKKGTSCGGKFGCGAQPSRRGFQCAAACDKFEYNCTKHCPIGDLNCIPQCHTIMCEDGPQECRGDELCGCGFPPGSPSL